MAIAFCSMIDAEGPRKLLSYYMSSITAESGERRRRRLVGEGGANETLGRRRYRPLAAQGARPRGPRQQPS